MLGRIPQTKEALLDFCENMDLNKWDTIVWYQVTRNPQEFRGLTGCQRDPRDLGHHSLVSKLRFAITQGLMGITLISDRA